MNTTQLPPLPKIVKVGSAEPCRTPWGEARVLMGSRDTGGALAVLEIHAEPGQGQPCQAHAREDRAIFVASGRFEVCLGEASLELGPGAFAFAPRGVPHAFQCAADEPGALYAWGLGEGSEEAVRLEGRIARAEETPAARLDLALRLGITQGASEVLAGASPHAFRQAEPPQGLRVPEERRRLLLEEPARIEEIATPALCGAPHERREEDTAYLVVAGRYEFCVADARALVEAGDTIWVPRGVPASWRAICAATARMVSCTAPARAA